MRVRNEFWGKEVYSMAITLAKYHGCGNDYLVYDPQKNNIELTPEAVRMLCDRNFGIGSDGIMIGPIFHQSGNIYVKILNPDGSEAEKSGNGVRIFAKYLKDYGYVAEDKFSLATLGGDIAIEFMNEAGTTVRVDMGKLSFWSDEVGVVGEKHEVVNERMIFNGKEYIATCVTIGNPHCVIPVKEISKDLICDIGQYAETAEYFPKRINTQIVKVIDRNNIQIEIFERGAGYTLASGSSSCAAAGAVHRLGLVDNEITVHMPGGDLYIEISPEEDVVMTGNVGTIGSFTLSEEFEKEMTEVIKKEL